MASIAKFDTWQNSNSRAARSEEFAPHDEVISKQIPGAASSQAESARQIIREKYAVIQNQIDSAEDISDLSKIVNSLS